MSLLVLAFLSTTPPPLVDVAQRLPEVRIELKYATPENFLGRALYPAEARCLLVEPALERLALASRKARALGYRLRLYDCYRPLSVQRALWKAFPRAGYVADPQQGSLHNRGIAVDLTLEDDAGQPLEMPTPFDTFSPAAHHSYTGGSAASRRNREQLRSLMRDAGFKENPMEWWHYAVPFIRNHPLRDDPFTP